MPISLSLAGRVAVVAGAGRGIGEAVALRLAEAGAAVAVVDSRADRAAGTVAAVRQAGGTAVPIIANLLDASQVDQIVPSATEQLGSVDILVNVAGGSWALAPYRLTHEVTDEEWSLIQAMNLTYVFQLTRSALGEMVQSGGGTIVHVGSIAGVLSSPLAAAYGAAKAGISSLTRTLAYEYGPFGIRVNCIAPGRINTPATAPEPGQQQADFTGSIPLRRMGVPAEIADAVAFLVSDLASYISGQTLLVDGGATATPGLILGVNGMPPSSDRVGGQA
ncbi:SDR family NAD(P)-dependent oxidoreductase [Dactylosporangium sp. CA-233914]|uniref:SDR family NAD(P)-dependent oxidoreductase n=1 Tax=Dactylosporangium sp. CA-233914 TaxID=3239934 RepID=UPI003D936C82